MLTIAVCKGRIFRAVLPLLRAAGCAPTAGALESRSLALPTGNPQIRLVATRAQDVATYVARGAAQAGIVGGDVLAEKPVDGVYVPLRLGAAKCRIVVAAASPAALAPERQPIAVASKYVNLARQFFAARGLRATFIKLSGAMELAPVLGVAEVIVDIAQTGATLRAHNLQEIAEVCRVEAVWIVNRAAARDNPQLHALQERLARAAARRGAAA